MILDGCGDASRMKTRIFSTISSEIWAAERSGLHHEKKPAFASFYRESCGPDSPQVQHIDPPWRGGWYGGVADGATDSAACICPPSQSLDPDALKIPAAMAGAPNRMKQPMTM